MNKKVYIQKKRQGESLFKGKIPLLLNLDIELTERCNNKCIHCYINLPEGDRKAEKRELSRDEVQEILKEAAGLGCLVVRFTGGEPLLRPDFRELYLFARKLGLKVIIFTNAILLSEEYVDLFLKIPPLEKIEVSLYGLKKESYEAVTRVSGSFKAAMRGINLLLKNDIPFVIKSPLLPPNKDELDELEEWTSHIPWMDTPVSCNYVFDLRAHRDDSGKNRSIKRLRLSANEVIDYLERNKGEYVKDMRRFCARYSFPQGNYLFSCGAGERSCHVDAYGNLQLCLSLRHPDTLYDLKKGTLRDAFENFFPGFRKLRAINSEYLKRCSKCFLKGFCEQCPAKSWMEYGTLDTPVEYLCELAHTQARFLGLLKSEEKAWTVKDWEQRIKEFSKEDLRMKGVSKILAKM